jgi:integrase/recombinase XerD
MKKYLLLDGAEQPVIPVVRYLKYLDNIGKSSNTLKSYCYHLKLFFQFLEQLQIGFQQISLDYLAEFIGWLRNPSQSIKVLNINEVRAKRSERTVNTIITCVIGFYDYLNRLEQHENEINNKVLKEISGRHRSFKPFLHHISKGKSINKNILRIKEPKRNIKTLSDIQIKAIYDACNNIRDKLLIRILYETGLRIGEALGLWIEDFNIGGGSISVRNSKTHAGKGRKVFITLETINLFQDYILDFHSFDIDSNFIFIKIAGANKGQQLTDIAIRSLVKRINKKTNIDFTPHLFRHTFATELNEKNTDMAVIQKLLGHAQVQTTIQTYLHPSESFIRQEYEKAHKNKKESRQHDGH